MKTFKEFVEAKFIDAMSHDFIENFNNQEAKMISFTEFLEQKKAPRNLRLR
jgi:hypothetical protein